MIVQQVLNNKIVVKHVYKKLNFPLLLGSLGHCTANLLIIGRENSWIVNATTSHKQHFVGTRLAVGLTSKASRKDSWARIETGILRYASQGSVVEVFCLHPMNGNPIKVSMF